jgi:hypothetical protein
MSPAGSVPLFRQLARAVDWRTVAAISLPVWGLVLGALVAHQPAPAAVPPRVVFVPQEVAPREEPTPYPREIEYRTQYQPVPVVLPVVSVAGALPELEAVGPFALPDSEQIAADKCKTYDTKIRFHAGMPDATAEARLSKKLLLVLHISGHFDDPGFT